VILIDGPYLLELHKLHNFSYSNLLFREFSKGSKEFPKQNNFVDFTYFTFHYDNWFSILNATELLHLFSTRIRICPIKGKQS